MHTLKRKADVVVVGSGPGGATVAREMARAGKKVLLVEKGRRHEWLGNHLTGLMIADKMGVNFTEEGLNVVRALTAGGSTIMYCGAATEPPEWFKTEYGIDLSPYVKDIIEELHLEPLPNDVIGTSAMRLMEAADTLGYHFEKLRKFIDPSKCRKRCGGTCMLGCPYGAKWSARAYIDDMKAAGGEFMTRTDVLHVSIQDGQATGVLASTPVGLLDIEADCVVLAAGGLGTPCILQKSGIHEAGRGMFLDPLVFVSGVSRFEGTPLSPPMSIGTYEFLEEGILLSDLIDPWGMWLLMALRHNPSKLLQFFSYRKQISLMVKIGDSRNGSISLDGRITKPMGEKERFRLNRGAAISREILIEAGCRPDSIMIGPVRGAHPGATARIGDIVDTDLQTRIENLYVSDASVLPKALDRPLVLTLISLGRRLADHLLQRERKEPVPT